MGDCEDHLGFGVSLTCKTHGIYEGNWHYGCIHINKVGGTSRNGSAEGNICWMHFGGLALEHSQSGRLNALESLWCIFQFSFIRRELSVPKDHHTVWWWQSGDNWKGHYKSMLLTWNKTLMHHVFDVCDQSVGVGDPDIPNGLDLCVCLHRFYEPALLFKEGMLLALWVWPSQCKLIHDYILN